jgi:ubiquitin C-terminal hydrolase
MALTSTKGIAGAAVADHGSGTDSEVDNHPIQPVLYDLQGLLCHSGSLHQGHYVAYVLQNVSSAATNAAAGKRWLK